MAHVMSPLERANLKRKRKGAKARLASMMQMEMQWEQPNIEMRARNGRLSNVTARQLIELNDDLEGIF